MRASRPGALALTAAALALAACQRGCARSALEGGRVGDLAHGLAVAGGVDCPDGLARCEADAVSVSRLATLPRPCTGSRAECSCPWEVAGECTAGCVAEGAELVVEPPLAMAQLCAPAADAGAWGAAWRGAAPPVACDDDDAFRCVEGAVLDCRSRTPIGRCVRGCFREGASVPDEGVAREAAFALLCSR